MTDSETQIYCAMADNGKYIQCNVPYERKDEFKHNIPVARWNDNRKVWEVPVTYFPELHTQDNIDINKDVARKYNKMFDKGRYRFTKDIEGLDAQLYPHQEISVGEMLHKPRYLLALGMGLGKTLSTIATALELRNQDLLEGNEQLLIVAPSSLKREWANEIEKFTDLSYTTINGTPEEREEKWGEDTFIKIMNYALLLQDEQPQKEEWGMIALDEASFIKNAGSKRTKKAKSLNSKRRYALSGTPVENDLTDLYNISTFLWDGYFLDKYTFKKRYVKEKEIDYGGNTAKKIIGHKNQDELREKIRPNMLRKSKDEVLDDLPPITTREIYLDLTEEQREEYDRLAGLFEEYIEKEDPRIGSFIHYLHMVSNGTQLINEAEENPILENQDLKPASSKIKELKRLLDKFENNSKKALIFTKWKTMANVLGKEIEKDTVVLHGEHSEKEREEGLEEFKENTDILIATDIFSYGANLQFADAVVHFDSRWNPQKMAQRRDRVHRIGQENPVLQIKLITSNTIEESIEETKEEKEELFQNVVDKAEEIDKEELKDLTRPDDNDNSEK